MPDLALGTVQLGLDYGISNQAGKVPTDKAKQLLEQAQLLTIDMLDTAALYGDSESILGQLAKPHFKLVTKLSIDTHSAPNLRQLFDTSLNRLQRSAIYGVLLHDAEVLTGPYASDIITQLKSLKESGLVKKIGVSLYHPEQVELFHLIQPDIIQVPLNILDQRFLANNLLAQLKAKGMEIHVRSAFLQGLLLMESTARTDYFNSFSELKQLDDFFSASAHSRLEICLNFLKSIREIDRVVVGCCSRQELDQINNAWHTEVNITYPQLTTDNKALIIPSNWPN